MLLLVNHGISCGQIIVTFLDTFLWSISSIPEVPHWGKEAIKEAVTYTQAHVSCVWIEISPCLPKFNPDLECQFSPLALPHTVQVGTSEKQQGKLPEAHGNHIWFYEFFTLTKILTLNCGQRNERNPKGFFLFLFFAVFLFPEKGATNTIFFCS